jgi:hypothetical protein
MLTPNLFDSEATWEDRFEPKEKRTRMHAPNLLDSKAAWEDRIERVVVTVAFVFIFGLAMFYAKAQFEKTLRPAPTLATISVPGYIAIGNGDDHKVKAAMNSLANILARACPKVGHQPDFKTRPLVLLFKDREAEVAASGIPAAAKP